MKKSYLHTFTIAIGIFTALVIVLSQLFYFQASDYFKKEAKTEKQEKQPSHEEVYISLPSISLPSSVQVELAQQSFYLFEILFEEGEEESKPIEISPSLSKFFQTLFRIIISPNAP